MFKPLITIVAVAVSGTAAAQTASSQTSSEQAEDDVPPAGLPTPGVPSESARPFDHVDSARHPSEPRPSPSEAASAPYSLSARVAPGSAWARAVAGYDSAAQAFRLYSAAETALTGYLALRADFEHGPSTSTTDRVSLGLRLQVLSQNAYGLDLGLGIFYQPRDFRGEGSIVAAIMFGRRFDRLVLLGSALLGSDPEGDDQEIDGRLGTLVRLTGLLDLGLDTRFRSVISTDAKRVGTSGVDWEMALLPNAVIRLGPLIFIGEAGFSALQTTEFSGELSQRKNLHAGFILMSGLGAAF